VRVLAGVAGGVLVLLVLAEFFVTFMLPRRVKRDPRIARRIVQLGWRGWRRAAHLLSPAGADTMLGFYGPASVVSLLGLWTLGLVLGFAAMQWATGTDLSLGHEATFGDTLFFSAGGFLSAGTGLEPEGSASQSLFIFEAACGFAVLPASAGALIQRSGLSSGWESLDASAFTLAAATRRVPPRRRRSRTRRVAMHWQTSR
jgi:hypothetical protein